MPVIQPTVKPQAVPVKVNNAEPKKQPKPPKQPKKKGAFGTSYLK
jgi:hypothetical protein